MNAPAIALSELFRVHRTAEGDAAALQGLTLRLSRGERAVVLGPSGAGKTTLLRILAGLEPPSAGSAEVLGVDLGRLGGRRRAAFRRAHIGVLDQFHANALPPALPCREALGLPLALRGADRRAREHRADELLERLGLRDRAQALPAELSGGERQRVAVGTALAHRPGLLLADEPGGELDAGSAGTVYALIDELARDEGATVVLVSHDPAATAIADRTLRLRDGRISGEAAGGAEAIVVGGGGWVRLPEELLAEAGLGDRLLARAGEGELVLTAAEGSEPVATPLPQPEALRAPAIRRDGDPAALRDVDKAYGDRVVLRGFDATFAPGRVTALSGRSGSGKSTILRLLAGLERPDGGSVVVGGRELGGASRDALAALRRERIAVVPQDVGLVGVLSAEENVVLTLAQRGIDDREGRRRAAAWLAEVGMAERARQRVERLSGGERQRVALARALAAEPALLLADEPTSRLDAANAARIAGLLAEVAERQGTTVVCATHEPLVVASAADVVEL